MLPLLIYVPFLSEAFDTVPLSLGEWLLVAGLAASVIPVLELVKSLTVSNGVIGDTNQFDARAQGSEGAASINLRGLGASRTLVLFNGRRLVNAPIGAGAPDVNLLPQAAVGRVEILKDGIRRRILSALSAPLR